MAALMGGKQTLATRLLAGAIAGGSVAAACFLARAAFVGILLLYCTMFLNTDRLPRVQELPAEGPLAQRPASPDELAGLPIPKIIHQTYKTEMVPEQWQKPVNMCRSALPDYEFMFWTDASAREFLAREYAWFLPTWDSYPYNIQRADAIRYFVLYHYGGIYLDLDVGCVRPPEAMHAHKGVILPTTEPCGFSNDVMASPERHPFMLGLIKALPKFNHYYLTRYPTVMFSTGPMFLTIQFERHQRTKQPGQLYVLPPSLYTDAGAEGEAFFQHFDGSSWHGADVKLIARFASGLQRHQALVTFVIGLILGSLLTSGLHCHSARVREALAGLHKRCGSADQLLPWSLKRPPSCYKLHV